MNQNKNESIFKTIRKLTLADVAFDQATALVSKILADGIDASDDDLYPGMLTGVSVSYAKPFMSAVGLGPLPASYSQFPVAKRVLGEVHSTLIEARNKVYGHRDFENAHTFLEGVNARSQIERVEMELEPNGGFWLVTNEPHLSREILPLVLELIAFQKERTRFEVQQKMLILAGSKKYQPGKYVVNNDGFEAIAT